MNFKKLLIAGVGISLAIGILLPVYSSAETTQGAALCAKLSEAYSKTAQSVAQKDGKITAKKNDVADKIKEHWEKQDANLAQKRQKWDENRLKQFTKMREKFAGDDQKQAVTAFEQAVSAAISARRTAIDLAISNFRQGVEQIKSSRQVKLDAAKTTFKNSVIAAFDKAKSDCQNGIAIAIVRQDLKNSIAAAKTAYQEDVGEIDKISAGMEQLIATRKTAFEKAIQNFKAAIEKAKTDFKAATAQGSDPDQSLELGCLNSGGTVAISSCCKSVKNFPNLCLIGACGCSPDNSKETKVCDCGEGKCFNGNSCVAAQ